MDRMLDPLSIECIPNSAEICCLWHGPRLGSYRNMFKRTSDVGVLFDGPDQAAGESFNGGPVKAWPFWSMGLMRSW
jgi:hypothetical protein